MLVEDPNLARTATTSPLSYFQMRESSSFSYFLKWRNLKLKHSSDRKIFSYWSLAERPQLLGKLKIMCVFWSPLNSTITEVGSGLCLNYDYKIVSMRLCVHDLLSSDGLFRFVTGVQYSTCRIANTLVLYDAVKWRISEAK